MGVLFLPELLLKGDSHYRFVLRTGELLPFEFLNYLVFINPYFLENILHSLLRKNVIFSPDLDLHVILIRMDSYRNVRGQSPGGCGPYYNGCKLLAENRVFDVYRIIAHVLVGISDFIPSERGFAMGAPVNGLLALHQHSLLPQPLDGPPPALEVIILVGHVGLYPASPGAKPLVHIHPYLFVSFRKLLTLVYEPVYPYLFYYFLFGFYAELLLHSILDRKPATVEAGLPP